MCFHSRCLFPHLQNVFKQWELYSCMAWIILENTNEYWHHIYLSGFLFALFCIDRGYEWSHFIIKSAEFRGSFSLQMYWCRVNVHVCFVIPLAIGGFWLASLVSWLTVQINTWYVWSVTREQISHLIAFYHLSEYGCVWEHFEGNIRSEPPPLYTYILWTTDWRFLLLMRVSLYQPANKLSIVVRIWNHK